MSVPSEMVSNESAPAAAIGARIDPAIIARVRPDAQQRNGKTLVVAGWVLTMIGVVLYCLVCFSTGTDADLGEILANGSVPFARGALGIVGLGTLFWLVGSLTYLRAAMDALETTPSSGEDTDPKR